MWDEINPGAQQAADRQLKLTPGVPQLPEPGVFSNFGSSAGNYFMRSMAEAGRAASMAFAAVPSFLDTADRHTRTHGDPVARAQPQEGMADRYFQFHDELFNNAVDYWTPKPSEVGLAGQITGQVMGGAVQMLANPALFIATQQMSTGEDLVRKGVDANAAVLAGDVAGILGAVGVRAPAAIGGNLAARVGSGAGINVAQGAAQAAITQQIVQAAGSPTVAKDFDPFDMKSRAVDAILGAVFGAKAHLDAATKDALMVRAQSLHLEEVGSPAKPATPKDSAQVVQATRAAIDQMLRGEPVQVSGLLDGVQLEGSPAKQKMRSDIEAETRTALQDVPTGEPIARPRMVEAPEPPKPDAVGPDGKKVEAVDPATARARAIAEKYHDLEVPVNDGETMPAKQALAKAEADAESAKTSGMALFKAAANCLLGAL